MEQTIRRSGRGDVSRSTAGNVAIVCSWLAVVAAAIAAPVAAGATLPNTAAYMATWVVSTTVPGVLVWRALSRPSSLAEELGFGSVVGIALLLLAWVPAVILGDALLAWWWPLTAVLVFASVPSLRRHWRPRRQAHNRLPTGWHVATALACVTAIGWFFVMIMRRRTLPGHGDIHVHPDLWFQQSLVNQLQYTLNVQQPEAAGEPKRYHWFSNADIAVTSQMSGVPSTTATFYLWMVVMSVLMVLAAVALARRLMDTGDIAVLRHWWVGPLAAFVAASLPITVVLGEPRLRNLGNGFIPVSTSGILGLVAMLALSGPVIDVLRARSRHAAAGKRPAAGEIALVVLLMALCAGTKPSNLPIAICALGLVAFVRLITERRISRTPLVLAVVAAVLIGASTFKLLGGSSGSGVFPFKTLVLDDAMQYTLEQTHSLSRVVVTGVGVFALYLASELPRLLGMLGVVYRRTRADPGVWWCAGVVFAGFCASWLVSQPGYSQQYFWRVVIVLAVVTSAVVAVRVTPPDVGVRIAAGPLVSVVAAGAAVGLWALLWWEPVDVTDPSTGPFDRLVPYGVALLVAAAVIGLWRIVRRTRTTVPVLSLVLVFSFAAGSPAMAEDLVTPVGYAARGEPVPVSSHEFPWKVTVEEQRAAMWLRENAGGEGAVVTNVVCVPTAFEPDCEHTAHWVAALSGLPMVMGGWAYTEKGRQHEVDDDRSYKTRPSPYPDRRKLSRAMIQDPSARVADRLRDRYNANWIFADRRATPVSDDIGQYAELVYRNEQVLVYSFDPSSR